jgi:hypothetical protein
MYQDKLQASQKELQQRLLEEKSELIQKEAELKVKYNEKLKKKIEEKEKQLREAYEEKLTERINAEVKDTIASLREEYLYHWRSIRDYEADRIGDSIASL